MTGAFDTQRTGSKGAAVEVATRTRMLEVAELLFAERGIAAVSLRQIGAAAGQRNNSAAQYHFGSKRKLIDAVFEYRMAPINERRLAMLATLERSGRGDEVRGLVQALVYPLAEAVTRDSHYLRFMAQALNDPTHSGLMGLDLEVMEGVRRVRAHLERSLSNLPAAVRAQRLLGASTLFVNALAQHERELQRGVPAMLPTAALAGNLVDMIVSMLTAPVSEPIRNVRRGRGRRSA